MIFWRRYIIKPFDKAFTETIEQYAKEFFEVLDRHPKAETPMLLTAMTQVVKAFMNSPYAISNDMKRLYQAMDNYLDENFDANVTLTFHCNDKSEEGNQL